jgi:XRE family aerobic/anaerobic benzoate catabolism transcriptional regulator
VASRDIAERELKKLIERTKHFVPSDKPPTDAEFLQIVGHNIRMVRDSRDLTRRELAKVSGVSERFLAQLETGKGNASILILRRIADALDTEIERLLYRNLGPSFSKRLTKTVRLLEQLDDAGLAQMDAMLRSHIVSEQPHLRERRIALIGLRGAGKSTLGALLARKMNVPFIELDKLVAAAAGTSLDRIFDMYGQAGFRRFERDCLEQVLRDEKEFVLATSGSIVMEPATYQRLLSECFTVWLKAKPEEHMQRVVDQGDMRPMGQNPEAIQDLRRILAEREHLYKSADVAVDTSDASVQASLRTLVASLRAANPRDAEAQSKP